MTHKSKVEWREVFDGYYEVSSNGYLRRIKESPGTETGRNLAGSMNQKGYKISHIWRNGKRKAFATHTIVAATFIGPRPDGLVINHKDGDKTNNDYLNLEYITPLENSSHAVAGGRFDNVRLTKKKREAIIILSAEMDARSIAEVLCVSFNTVRSFLKGKTYIGK